MVRKVLQSQSPLLLPLHHRISETIMIFYRMPIRCFDAAIHLLALNGFQIFAAIHRALLLINLCVQLTLVLVIASDILNHLFRQYSACDLEYEE